MNEFDLFSMNSIFEDPFPFLDPFTAYFVFAFLCGHRL